MIIGGAKSQWLVHLWEHGDQLCQTAPLQEDRGAGPPTDSLLLVYDHLIDLD